MAAAVVSLQSLPLGFRFQPTDEELVNHYLKRKIEGRIDPASDSIIPVVDLSKSEPWDLPGLSTINLGDPEWFFFAPKDRKYPSGCRANRATQAGYWKATGKDRTIKSRPGTKTAVPIGMKKTLVFHRGRAPKGERTGWIMHEYRMVHTQYESGPQGAFVLCRLFNRLIESKSSASNNETGKIASSPVSISSIDKQHEIDLFEPVPTPLNKNFPAAGLLEGPPHLAEKIDNPASHSFQAVQSATPNETSHGCGHATEIIGEGDPDVEETFRQLLSPEHSNLDLDIDSILLPYADCHFDEDVTFDLPFELSNTPYDSVMDFLDIVADQEDGSSAISTFTMPTTHDRENGCMLQAVSPLEAISSKESEMSSDIETEVGNAQDGLGFDPSEFISQLPFSSSDCLHMNTLSSHTRLSDNASSVFSDGHYLFSYNNMEESANQGNWEFTRQQSHHPSTAIDSLYQKNHNVFDVEETGINIRSRMSQNVPNYGCSHAQQGTALRRILLQHSGPSELVSTVTSDSCCSSDVDEVNADESKSASLSEPVLNVTSDFSSSTDDDEHKAREFKEEDVEKCITGAEVSDFAPEEQKGSDCYERNILAQPETILEPATITPPELRLKSSGSGSDLFCYLVSLLDTIKHTAGFGSNKVLPFSVLFMVFLVSVMTIMVGVGMRGSSRPINVEMLVRTA